MRMVSDLDPQASKVLQQFCVAAVIRKASRKLLPKGKVPAMGLLIETLCAQNPDAKVMLKDKSGSIGGTIHRQLMKEYPDHFHPGTVLLLRQIGVFSPNAKTHYLNITPNNLVKVYNRGDVEDVQCSVIGEFTAEDLMLHISRQVQGDSNYGSPTSSVNRQNTHYNHSQSTAEIPTNAWSSVQGHFSPATGSLQNRTVSNAGTSWQKQTCRDKLTAYGGNVSDIPARIDKTIMDSPLISHSNTTNISTANTPLTGCSGSKKFSFRKVLNSGSPVLSQNINNNNKFSPANFREQRTINSDLTGSNMWTGLGHQTDTAAAENSMENVWEDDLDEVMSEMPDDIF